MTGSSRSVSRTATCWRSSPRLRQWGVALSSATTAGAGSSSSPVPTSTPIGATLSLPAEICGYRSNGRRYRRGSVHVGSPLLSQYGLPKFGVRESHALAANFPSGVVDRESGCGLPPRHAARRLPCRPSAALGIPTCCGRHDLLALRVDRSNLAGSCEGVPRTAKPERPACGGSSIPLPCCWPAQAFLLKSHLARLVAPAFDPSVDESRLLQRALNHLGLIPLDPLELRAPLDICRRLSELLGGLESLGNRPQVSVVEMIHSAVARLQQQDLVSQFEPLVKGETSSWDDAAAPTCTAGRASKNPGG